jgi:hypothetical protein
MLQRKKLHDETKGIALKSFTHDRTKQIQKNLQRAQSSQNMERVKTMIIETENKNQRLNESRRKTNLHCIASLDALQINDHGSVPWVTLVCTVEKSYDLLPLLARC